MRFILHVNDTLHRWATPPPYLVHGAKRFLLVSAWAPDSTVRFRAARIAKIARGAADVERWDIDFRGWWGNVSAS